MNKQSLIDRINNFILTAPENWYLDQFRYYDEPLIGFADANDELFTELKKDNIVGPMFKHPDEWLPGAATAISFFLPSTEHVRKSNHPAGAASDEWMHARFKGDAFINHIRRFIVSEIEKAGGRAIAPHIDPTFHADFTLYTSNWSERHVAYIAGLGTFSLNRGLITEKGMAGRFGSVVTDLTFEPTPRKYTDPFQHCLFTREGKCGACIKRCPVNAITTEGKDKYPCHQYLFFTNPRKELNDQHGYPYSACGKCQTKVPCEHQIP